MMKTLVLSMLVLSTTLAVAGNAAAATSSPYAVAPNQTLAFFVQGTTASLNEVAGDAHIASMVPLAGGLLRVDVACDTLIPCAGLVVGA